MNKKDLGLVLGSLFIAVMVISLITGGVLGLILSSVLYYFGVGFFVTEFTGYSTNVLTWLTDLASNK